MTIDVIGWCNDLIRNGEEHHEAEARIIRDAVADLIETANGLLAYRQGKYPVEGYLRDNDASRAQIDALAYALANVQPASTQGPTS